jgi:WhiB family transcriptional regulator, redox-sensing transcriptional regulator
MDATTTYIGGVAEARIAWVSKARCRSSDPDELFVGGAAQRKAAVICRHCPVVAECLADALDNQMEFGVWGGMTERQRRVLLKEHPEVVSWSKFFGRPAQASQHRKGMIIRHQPTRAAAKRAKAMANSVEANERRREREPTVIDWDEAIANLLDILDDIYDERRG